MPSLRVSWLLLVFFLFARPGGAQALALPAAAGPVAVDGPWMTYEGDPPGGAAAAGDPRPAKEVRLHDPAGAASNPRILWYRATLRLDAQVDNPALLIAPRTMACQIYVNGVLGADCNQLSAPNSAVQRGLLVRLPAGGAAVNVAIRLESPMYVRTIGQGFRLGLGPGNVLFGSGAALADHRAAEDARHVYDLFPQALLCLAELLGGALLLVVFAFDRRSREYLWFAVFLWLDGSCSLLSVFQRAYPILSPAGHAAADVIGMIARYVPLIEFLAAFTAVRIPRWVRAYEAILIALPLAMSAWGKLVELGLWQWWGGADSAFLLAQIPFVAGSIVFLVVHRRRGNREAGLLLPPFLLANGIEILGLTTPWFRDRFHVGPMGFDTDDLSMFFFLVSIGPVMLFRHRRITLEHAHAAAELDAAREIQQQLVPPTLPALPGCRIAAAYLPAQEVGGDFYQVLPQPDGSAVIAVGDVSGKGLKAAMTGALTIGALRALASEALGPAELLTRLNAELVRAQSGGFVTCFCAVLTPDCALRFANAGHLAPYRNGTEIASPGSLPLGLSAHISYDEFELQMEPGDRLTLLSDGVVEAQGAEGELFGFERVREISAQDAEAIARAAQRFGQTDDISVVTLERVAFA